MTRSQLRQIAIRAINGDPQAQRYMQSLRERRNGHGAPSTAMIQSPIQSSVPDVLDAEVTRRFTPDNGNGNGADVSALESQIQSLESAKREMQDAKRKLRERVDRIDDIAPAGRGRTIGAASAEREEFGSVGRSEEAGKGGYELSEPIEVGNEGDHVTEGDSFQVEFSRPAMQSLTGQHICYLQVLGFDEPAHAARFTLDLEVNDKESFGGVVDLPLLVMSVFFTEPRNRFSLRDATGGGYPKLALDTTLTGRITAKTSHTLEADTTLQLAVVGSAECH